MACTAGRLDSSALSRSEFRETSRNSSVAAFVRSQSHYLKLFAVEGAKEAAKWQSERAPTEAAMRHATTSAPLPGSPLLVPRAARTTIAAGGREEQTPETRAALAPDVPATLVVRKGDRLGDIEMADCLDEHTLRLAERRERRRAKAAILKPKPSPPKKSTTRKRKPDHPSPAPTSTKAATEDEDDNASPVRNVKGKKDKAKKKQKMIPPTVSLLQNLAPNNIGRERLTLKPPSSIGVFNKGKASSRVEIKDRPKPKTRTNGLVFSESRFFNKHTRTASGTPSVASDPPIPDPKPVKKSSGKRRAPPPPPEQQASSTESSSSDSVVTFWSASPPPAPNAARSPTQASKSGVPYQQPISTAFSTLNAKWRVDHHPPIEATDEAGVDHAEKPRAITSSQKDDAPAQTEGESHPHAGAAQEALASITPVAVVTQDTSRSVSSSDIPARLPQLTSLQELIKACDTAGASLLPYHVPRHHDCISLHPHQEGSYQQPTARDSHIYTTSDAIPPDDTASCDVSMTSHDRPAFDQDMAFQPIAEHYDRHSAYPDSAYPYLSDSPAAVFDLQHATCDAYLNYPDDAYSDCDSVCDTCMSNHMDDGAVSLSDDLGVLPFSTMEYMSDIMARDQAAGVYELPTHDILEGQDPMDLHNNAAYIEVDDTTPQQYAMEEDFADHSYLPPTDPRAEYLSEDSYDDEDDEDNVSTSFATGRILLDKIERVAVYKGGLTQEAREMRAVRPLWPRHKP